MKQVSVVIPNYNGKALMAKHLPAVMTMMRSGDELIIVDDCSTDPSLAWLHNTFHLEKKNTPEKEFSEYAQVHTSGKKKISIRVIQNKKNLRFAGNTNRGVGVATHPLVFLLNTDVSPAADVLEHVLPHFDDPQVFAVGCLEKEQHGKEIVFGGKKTLTFTRGMFIHARAKEFESGETDWVSGGSAIFDRQKWLEIGGFDLRFAPAYWEDVDISFQAKKRGWKLLFEKSAVVDHNHESTNMDEFGRRKIEEMSWRNAYRFVWKNATLRQKILHIIWQPYWWLKRS